MIKVENNFKAYEKKLLDCIKAAGQEVKITEIANIQSNTPVKTGALKRSITGSSDSNGNNLKIKLGSRLVYARKVEFKNKSYIRATLKGDMSNIANIFIKHLKEGMS